MSWDRVVLLGEDRAHLDFLRRLRRELGWSVAFEHIAPHGQGAASGWVIQQFSERLAEIRAGYAGLGLLVAIDGDNQGRQARLAALERACKAASQPERSEDDAVAILVPSWSIDTWGLFFCKDKVIPENKKSKSKARSLFEPPHRGFLAPGAPAEDAPRVWKLRHLETLTQEFLSDRSHTDLPSLDSSRADLRRWTAP